MSILVYNKKSSYLAFDLDTVEIGSVIFKPEEKQIGSIVAPGVIQRVDNEVVLNDKAYGNFIDALAEISGKAILKLTSNVVLANPIIIPVDAEVELDLNGYSIAAAPEMVYTGGMITIPHGATLIINGEGSISVNDNVYAPLQMTHRDYADDSKVAKLVINGGHFIGSSYAICGNGNRGRGNSEVIINKGILESDTTAIFNPQENSSVIINGGTIIGKQCGIEMRSGNLTINGGKIESFAAPASVTPNGNGVTSIGSAVAICQHTTKNPINVEINGGTMKGYHALYQANPQKNDEAAIALVSMVVNNGKFIATQGSTMSVYSENKEHFIKGGSFSPEAEEKYLG